MRFRWRRHVTETITPVTHAPQLTDEQVLQVIESRLSEHFGPRGSWSLVRRSGSDTDVLFQEFLTHSIAVELTTDLREHAAAPIENAAAPVSPDWKPEPIAAWAETEDHVFRPHPADLTALVASMTPDAATTATGEDSRHVA